jgi:hypothetical protein
MVPEEPEYDEDDGGKPLADMTKYPKMYSCAAQFWQARKPADADSESVWDD